MSELTELDREEINADSLLSLLKDIKSELQCRIDGLTKTWPAPEILTCLHRNEGLMERLNRAIVASKGEK